MAIQVSTGERMWNRIADLYPIPRSLTGDGVRATLRQLQAEIPLVIHEVPTGTPVFDWTAPREWNLKEAWVKGPDGKKVVDVRDSSLHILGYSTPVDARVSRSELDEHLFSLPDHPDWIPYRTSYYRETWGFCLAHRVREALPPGDYEVHVDATLGDGSLTYGELLIPGESDEEYLFSAHVCHPALCNDNLSGITVAVELARALARVPRRWSYRFVFAPGTIGAITWLARNEDRLERLRGGLVLTCVGDRGPMTYKRTRRGDAEIDRTVAHVLHHSGAAHAIEDFSPLGYDERQYNSPGIARDVGCLMRTPHGRFPEYHTSADNLDFVVPECLEDSLQCLLAVVEVLEGNRTYRRLKPKGEPQLGRRGLFKSVGGLPAAQREAALLWVLNQADGSRDLLAIAERSGLEFGVVAQAAKALLETDLLDG